MKHPDDEDWRPWLQVGDFPRTKSASLHKQRCQFLRIGQRPEKTIQFLGVRRSTMPPHRWQASITNQDAKLHRVYLGSFATEELAARAYDLVSLASYGPEGTTNFPKVDYKGMGSKWARAVVAALASGEPAEIEGAREALAKAAQHVVTEAARKSG